MLSGDTSGKRSRTAGTPAAPAASGFLLRSGLAVAGPRAPVAYCFSTYQCVHRGEGLRPSFLVQTLALVGEAA